MGAVQDLVRVLRGGSPADELKAMLVVRFGVHPDRAVELAGDPLGFAARIERTVADVESLLLRP